MYKIAFTAFVKIDQIQGLAVYNLQKRILDIQFMIFRFFLDICVLVCVAIASSLHLGVAFAKEDVICAKI